MLSIRNALIFTLACAAAGTQAQTLTLERAQRLAVERSRQLAARDAVVSASRDMAVAAAQNPDPVLRFGVENLPADGADRFNIGRDFMTMRRIGVMQEFTGAQKRKLRGERFEREADKSLAEKAVTVSEIQRGSALAWLDRYYAEAMAALMTEQIRQARLEIEAAESAYRGGRGSQADVLTARAALIGMEDRASELGRRVSTANVTLGRWVGDAAEQPLSDKPVTDQVRHDPGAIDTQLEHHPEIAALTRQMDLAYSLRGPVFSNMVSVGVSIPLQWDQKNRQDRELAAKLAMVEQARAQRDEMLRVHAAELRAMLIEWKNARERHARIESELVPLAAERSEAILSAYRGGKSSLNEVLAARRNETEVRAQALQLEMEAARLWAQLNFLVPDGETDEHGGVPHVADPVLKKDTQ
jgi:outer membrane protein TolC